MNTPLYTPTKQGEQTMTKLTCKHQQHHHTCINLHDCHRCHQQHYPHLLQEGIEEETT